MLVEYIAENNFGDTRSGSLAGPLGLLVVVLLALGTVLLIRNMNQRLKRLPDRFPSQDDAPGAERHAPGAEGRDADGSDRPKRR